MSTFKTFYMASFIIVMIYLCFNKLTCRWVTVKVIPARWDMNHKTKVEHLKTKKKKWRGDRGQCVLQCLMIWARKTAQHVHPHSSDTLHLRNMTIRLSGCYQTSNCFRNTVRSLHELRERKLPDVLYDNKNIRNTLTL